MKSLSENALKFALLLCLGGMGYIVGSVAGSYYVAKDKKETRVVLDHKYSSIVRLVEGGKTFCTGTVIAKNLILTASHCALLSDGPFNMSRPYVLIRPTTNKAVHISASVLYVNQRMDQALLIGDFSDFEVRPVITDPNVLSGLVKQKTQFISCGYPFNGALFCNTTVFSEVQDFFWAVDGTLLPGMSGGPTMLPDGTVVAVNIAVEKNKSIVSPIYNLFNYMKGHK